MRCPHAQALLTLQRLIAIETDECVLWPYAIKSSGNGSRKRCGTINLKGKTISSHTLAWELSHPDKTVPDGVPVRHSCSNHFCVNIRHLYLAVNDLVTGTGLSVLLKMISRDTNDCIRWPHAHGGHGYGMVSLGKANKIGTHVVSWVITNKVDVPDGMEVCHTCDVKDCVNSKHLFIGTSQDNNQDKVSKQRHRFGIIHPFAKLTEDQVRVIRELSNLKLKKLAVMFGVAESAISKIRSHKRWHHIA